MHAAEEHKKNNIWYLGLIVWESTHGKVSPSGISNAHITYSNRQITDLFRGFALCIRFYTMT